MKHQIGRFKAPVIGCIVLSVLCLFLIKDGIITAKENFGNSGTLTALPRNLRSDRNSSGSTINHNDYKDPRLSEIFGRYSQLNKSQVDSLVNGDPPDFDKLAAAAWFHQENNEILSKLRANPSKSPLQLTTLYHFSLNADEKVKLANELIRVDPGNALGGLLYAKAQIDQGAIEDISSLSQYFLNQSSLTLPTQAWKKATFETWRTCGKSTTESQMLANNNSFVESSLMRQILGLAEQIKKAKYDSTLNEGAPIVDDVSMFEHLDTLISSYAQDTSSMGELSSDSTTMAHMRILGMLPPDSSIAGGSSAKKRIALQQESMRDDSNRDTKVQSVLRKLEPSEVDAYFTKAFEEGTARANEWLLSEARDQE